MSRLWVPNGNNAQIDIDIQISQILYIINQCENDRQFHTYEAIKLLALLDEVRTALRYAKNIEGITVSMSEYSLMIRDEKRYKKELESFHDMIHDCDEFIKMQNQKVAELRKQREKVATKILDFKRK